MDNKISFTVDAGLINRLGIELVARSETAVSELIKNSYDADATLVEVVFKDTREVGGSLVISDNGEGMSYESLSKGFMRLSSSDKIHNPKSAKFGRTRAGKKGIGRFATQRLGEKLTILTKTADMEQAVKLYIDWNLYQIDLDLTSVEHEVSFEKVSFIQGTVLLIENLRDKWSEADIKRVYRYVSELFQPDFLDDRGGALRGVSSDENVFSSRFFFQQGEDKVEVASPDKMLFDRAFATIEGLLIDGEGLCRVKSNKFNLDDEIKIVLTEGKDGLELFENLKNDIISFKLYYFIYDRPDYYDFDASFGSMEYNNIKKLAAEKSGVRMYRNGFRVLPYGEPGNDWLDIDRDISKVGSRLEQVAIPFRTKNLFGFVEIIGNTGFEETASREGLIEGPAFSELKLFMQKSLRIASLRIASAPDFVNRKKVTDKERDDISKRSQEMNARASELKQKIESGEPNTDEEVKEFLHDFQLFGEQSKAAQQRLETAYLDEIAVLRVLATSGLMIAEFTHEVENLLVRANNYVLGLKKQLERVNQSSDSAEQIIKAHKLIRSWGSFFQMTVSQGSNRVLTNLNLQDIVNDFSKFIFDEKFTIKKEFNGSHGDFYTCKMHEAEWYSILLNLYSNARKAILRKKPENYLMLISLHYDEKYLYLDFLDNGNGIPVENRNRIFNRFFTTSEVSTSKSAFSGSGLGLSIIKNIIEEYKGEIKVVDSILPYSTCFRIKIPSKNHEN